MSFSIPDSGENSFASLPDIICSLIDINCNSRSGDDDDDDEDKPKLSKRKMKKLNRLSVAELKQLVTRYYLIYSHSLRTVFNHTLHSFLDRTWWKCTT